MKYGNKHNAYVQQYVLLWFNTKRIEVRPRPRQAKTILSRVHARDYAAHNGPYSTYGVLGSFYIEE